MTDLKHVVCPHCNATNRLPIERLAAGPKCGKCGGRIFGGHPVELNDVTFDKHVGQNDIPVVVDFWAPWCAPCKMMAPAFEKAAVNLEPRVRLAKLNTDEAQEIAGQMGIRSIPTMILFENGQEVARHSGAMMAGDIENWVNAQLK